MTVFTEGGLQITVNNAVSARKFDDGTVHRLTHCMQAVDFIIELADHYLFIEFKDPQNPPPVADSYQQRFTAGRIDRELQYKYRDTFLYEWAAGRADKPIDYLILIALDALKPAHLHIRRREMERKLPLLQLSFGQWTRPIVRNCYVLNIASWNRHFPDYPIQRLSP